MRGITTKTEAASETAVKRNSGKKGRGGWEGRRAGGKGGVSGRVEHTRVRWSYETRAQTCDAARRLRVLSSTMPQILCDGNILRHRSFFFSSRRRHTR